MAPNSIGAFLFKKNWKKKSKDPQAMTTILIVLHDTQLVGFQKPTGFNRSMYLTISQNMASYDLFYKSIIQTPFWKEMYQ